MKRCKMCGGRLHYSEIQSPGRVSTYNCPKCKRTVDIPFKPEDYCKSKKATYSKEIGLAKWYIKKMGSYSIALARLKKANELVEKEGFKPKELK